MGRLVKKRVFILIIFSQNILERFRVTLTANVCRFKLRISQNRKYADKMKAAQSNSYG